MARRYPTVLSIAGSDSIGGAGIQADIKTCCALGVYAMTAITAVTEQNTCGVRGYEAVSAKTLRGQLEAVTDDVRPDAVKIGMLPSVELQEVVVEWIKGQGIGNVVLDPVMVATSGHRLSDDDACGYMTRRLFPLVDIITPNIPEAEVLLRRMTGSDSLDSIRSLLPLVPYVLLKGGHSEGEDSVTDCLYSRESAPTPFTHRRIHTANTHGTGCSLSAAIASHLALGYPMKRAVAMSVDWLQKAIVRGAEIRLGHGHGPVCHNFEHGKFIDTDESHF